MQGPTSHLYFSQRLRLHYVDWGNDEAPPLLMIHGGRDHCRNWDWVAARLLDRYHIIAPDLRGHGDSEWASGSYTDMNYVYDIAQLIHQKHMAPVTIMAHSLGSSVSLIYAGLFPETVSKLIAIEGMGPPPHMMGALTAPIEQRMREWVLEKRKNAGRVARKYPTLEAAIARMIEENKHLNAEQARHLTIHGASQNEDGTYSWKFDDYVRVGGSAGNIPLDQIHRIWRNITCPVLLFRGTESWASDPQADGRAAHIRNGRFVNVEGAGHWVHHDKLDVFMEHVEAFLAE